MINWQKWEVTLEKMSKDIKAKRKHIPHHSHSHLRYISVSAVILSILFPFFLVVNIIAGLFILTSGLEGCLNAPVQGRQVMTTHTPRLCTNAEGFVLWNTLPGVKCICNEIWAWWPISMSNSCRAWVHCQNKGHACTCCQRCRVLALCRRTWNGQYRKHTQIYSFRLYWYWSGRKSLESYVKGVLKLREN